ncbi:4-carboxymuconolactone decarboxylase domain/alkylhydroperoxidase AhpD family core domain protein [Labilithrix luteola]|uniref:4-carboxymuconolactone decarboxylase domain/alkylhydroperoxidase AhpD family core domain protein n=1 Tax=Labilithrix luteola TaxID=1391654 RepID=A0A0K1Q460_9BACT|nr:carboxymuconolactone decarboxylase family protein [Labilithrix luteola]AKV00538.1 4-carboxymuconolactone decarboxylase domain/alkylhydroperoxidase AhpD family core domain protein [Labilithrix luteola]
MQARMKQPAMVIPEAMRALLALSKAAHESGVPDKTIHLVHIRASQINGCAVCVEMHVNDAKKSGDTDQRLHLVAAWREAPYFTDAERAALALTEALTRVADRPEAVTDEIWNEAARHYDEKALSGLLLEIGAINVWNRLNLATRQVAGSFR